MHLASNCQCGGECATRFNAVANRRPKISSAASVAAVWRRLIGRAIRRKELEIAEHVETELRTRKRHAHAIRNLQRERNFSAFGRLNNRVTVINYRDIIEN